MRAAMLIAIWMSATAGAQDLLWRAEGVAGQQRRGIAIKAIGDVNGDGFEDMAEMVQLRTAPGQWCCWTSFMAVSSGRDGSLLSVAQNLSPTGIDQFSPSSLAWAGDVDGDGIGDYCYTRSEPQLAQTLDLVVRSGGDHHVLWIQSAPFGSRFGISTTGGFDVNGDGRCEVATFNSFAGQYGTLYVFDSSGAPLYTIANPNPNLLYGVDLAPLGGDLDNDGGEDFLAACPDTGVRGAILVLSGRTGNVLRTCYGELPGDYLVHCAGCGDVDGDGAPDFVGSSHDLVAMPCVTTFSGRTGQVIRSCRGVSYRPPSCTNGYFHPPAAADLDQDGVPDIVAGTGSGVFAFSGRAGDEMFVIHGDGWPLSPCPTGGMRTIVLRPPPGEYYPVVVVTEDIWAPTGYQGSFLPGLVRAFRTSAPTVATFGRALASSGRTPRMGMRDLGGSGIRLSLSDARSGASALLVLGFSNQAFGGTLLPASLAPLGLPGMLLLVSPDAMLATIVGTSGLDRGCAQIDVPLQMNPAGIPLFAQWAWLDPANASAHGSSVGHAFRVR